MSTRYREGGVTVTLTGDLESWAERAIKAALGGAVLDEIALYAAAEAESLKALGLS